MTKPVYLHVIGTCGHLSGAYVQLADWADWQRTTVLGYPAVRDTVPCAACREGRTPAWDRTREGRRAESIHREKEARRKCAELGFPQPVIDRAASFASDVFRGRRDGDAWRETESAVQAAIRDASAVQSLDGRRSQ